MEVKPGYKQTEAGVIPKDWEVVPLAELSRSICDGTHFTPRYVPYGVPFYSVENVTARNFTDTKFISEFEHKLLVKRCKPERGDILMTRITAGVLGDTVLIDWDVDASIYVSLALIKPNGRVRPEYLFRYSQSPAFVSAVEKRGLINATPKKINMIDIGKVPIPLPPTKSEQEKIARALSDAEALIASLEQLIAKKRRIKQGVMQELLTGKRRLPGFNNGWQLKRFGEIVHLRSDRVDPSRTAPFDFCLELEHFSPNSGRLTGSSFTTETSSLKSTFRKDDVLFGKLRAYLRKYWLANRDGVCSTEIWVLVAEPDCIAPAYLFQIVQTDAFIESASTAYGTHMPRSDWNVVKRIELRLPCIKEQVAIASVLAAMDSEIAALDTKLEKTRLVKQGIMQELLTGRIRLV